MNAAERGEVVGEEALPRGEVGDGRPGRAGLSCTPRSALPGVLLVLP